MPIPRYAATNAVTLYTLFFPRLPVPDIRGVVIKRGADPNYALPALLRDLWRSRRLPIDGGVLGDAAAEDNTGKVVVEADGSILVSVSETVVARFIAEIPFVVFESDDADALKIAEDAETTRTKGSVALPSMFKQALTLAGSVVDWAGEGFAMASKEIYDSRLQICKTCPELDPNGFGPGLIRCKKCGCSGAKLHMETSTCPLMKW